MIQMVLKSSMSQSSMMMIQIHRESKEELKASKAILGQQEEIRPEMILLLEDPL